MALSQQQSGKPKRGLSFKVPNFPTLRPSKLKSPTSNDTADSWPTSRAEGHNIAGGDGGVPATPATVQISSLSGENLVCPKPFVSRNTFEQNLENLLLFEAGRQLINREECLFGPEATHPLLSDQNDQVDQLAKDHTALLGRVTQAMRESLDPAKESVEVLKSAVRALLEEAEQDKKWASAERRSMTPPAWRPCWWRKLLDTTLQKTVEERMDAAAAIADQEGSGRSSVQMDIDGKGKRIKDDLQRVVEVLKDCYPVVFDICNLFARLYHQDFSSRLCKIADEKDCEHVLRWTNEYYPKILQKYERDIDWKALGKLLPENLCKPMEEQYLTNLQANTKKLIDRILKKEEEVWTKGDTPVLEEHYSSPLAIDVIECIDGAKQSVEVYLGDQQKALAVMCLLKDFLQSFNKFHEDVMKGTPANVRQFSSNNLHEDVMKANSKPVTMANLICVEQFRDFIIKKTSLFPEEVRESCLSTVTAMKESGYAYLLSPLHKDLKPQYKKLGTSEWLNEPLFEELLDNVGKCIQDLKGLNESCHQELMGRLEKEVTMEYVTRLLRDKVKLRNREKQEQAAKTVTENGHSLHKLFSEKGSREDWLANILPKIAEVLRLQDLPSIQLEVASLAEDYPDLSVKHISALLKLKTNLSTNDRRTVEDTFQDSLAETNRQDFNPFFSKIQIKKPPTERSTFASCFWRK